MSIRSSALLTVFFLNLLTTGLMAAASYDARSRSLNGHFNRLLEQGAEKASEQASRYGAEVASRSPSAATVEQLQKDFERVIQDEHLKGKHLRLNSIYTLVRDGEQLYFTSNYEDSSQGNSPKPGDPYKGFPPEILEVFNENKQRVLDYTDEYGHWHSLFRPIQLSTGEQYVIGVDISSETLEQAHANRLTSTLAVGLVTLMFSMPLGLMLVNRLMYRIEALVAATQCTVALDFKPDAKLLDRLKELSTKAQDEITMLASALLSLLKDLDNHIQKLTKVEGELQAAKDIQTSLLPKIVPPLTSCPEFDIQAELKPAREVGGDLYDCFWTDENHLFVAVGDVSDKGVSAALLMTATMALLKTEVMPGTPLNEAIGHINALLSENNEQMNFVTLFCGVLDVRTGEMEYCNAGHLPPCLLPREGSPRFLDVANNPALGVYPDYQFVSGKFTLPAGDRIFLYTDGVTEAMSPTREQFTEERLLSTLEGMQGTERELLDTMLGSVRGFAGEAPQSDDIAMLVLRYRGEQSDLSARQALLENPRIRRNIQARSIAA